MANILIDVGHPAHVHLFRGAARDWTAARHQVLFTALDREIILDLLKIYRLPYRVTYKRRKGTLAKVVELVFRTLSTYRIARNFKADLFVSFGNPTVGIPAKLMGKPYIAFTDTEHATEQHALFKPFATVIATPDVFTRDLGPKQVRYAGFHELAYLQPMILANMVFRLTISDHCCANYRSKEGYCYRSKVAILTRSFARW